MSDLLGPNGRLSSPPMLGSVGALEAAVRFVLEVPGRVGGCEE